MQIFLSYSRINQDLARTLCDDLRELGHTVWMDRELTGGQVWWNEILSRIRGCDSFLFVLSPDGLNSEACKREFAYAAALHKRIVPVLVADDISLNLLPPELSEIQFVDYRVSDKRSFGALNKALQKLPQERPLPDPLPAPPGLPVSYLSSLVDDVDAALPLEIGEQLALVFKLREALAKAAEREDAIKLLRRLRANDTLLAKAASEIDQVLAKSSMVPPAPPADPSSTESRTEPKVPATAFRSDDVEPEQRGGTPAGLRISRKAVTGLLIYPLAMFLTARPVPDGYFNEYLTVGQATLHVLIAVLGLGLSLAGWRDVSRQLVKGKVVAIIGILLNGYVVITLGTALSLR